MAAERIKALGVLVMELSAFKYLRQKHKFPLYEKEGTCSGEREDPDMPQDPRTPAPPHHAGGLCLAKEMSFPGGRRIPFSLFAKPLPHLPHPRF